MQDDCIGIPLICKNINRTANIYLKWIYLFQIVYFSWISLIKNNSLIIFWNISNICMFSNYFKIFFREILFSVDYRIVSLCIYENFWLWKLTLDYLFHNLLIHKIQTHMSYKEKSSTYFTWLELMVLQCERSEDKK